MRRSIIGLALLLALLLTGCGLFGHPDGPDDPTPNRVRFTLDGQAVEILEELSFAVHDQSRDLMGPHTELYLEAGSPATDPDRILGPKLQINLPEGTTPGAHRLAHALLPSDRGPWVRFRESASRTWVAHDGELTVHEVGAVGGRMRLSFDQLQLASDCGEERTLGAGEIDVAVGAEAVFPEAEVDLNSVDPGQLERLGSTVALKVDGRRWLCSFELLGVETVPGSLTDTGAPVDAVQASAICACGVTASGEPAELRWLAFIVPTGAAGPVAIEGAPYYFIWGVDEGTPLDLQDDQLYRPTQSTEVVYAGPMDRLGAEVGLEATSAFVMSAYDPVAGTVDPTRNLIVADLRAVGRIDRDCRPDRCL